MPEPARAAKPVNDALADGKRKTAAGRARPPVGSAALFALQRSAGNSAVNALLAGRWRSPGAEARTDIDAALTEMRRDEPAIDTVEKGLKRAKAAGVPVELEGPKPPASALAVTKTGFGPASVAPKKPVPPTKPVPKVSPLGKAAAKRAKSGGGGPRGAAPPAAPAGGGATAIPAAPLSADQLLQPPVAPKSITPDQDPAFKQVTGNVKAFAKDKRAHPPAASKAKEAQDAALAPSDDMTGQAKEAKVASMDAQQAGSFDKKAFIAAVKAAIEAKSPKTLKEADNYAKSGKAGEVKGEVKGLVNQGKEGQKKGIETATAAPPDTSKGLPKPVTAMGPEQQGPAASIPAAGAVPKPAPPEQLNLEAGKQQANQEMAGADVSEKQLAESNEPDFEQALADKKEAAAHADTAPGEFRKHEQDVITQAKTEAAAETKAGVAGMQGAKGAALAKLVADKGKTKSKDEAKRAEVTAKVQSIYAKTEKDVGEILEAIDPKVENEFETGEKKARAVFETYVSAKMSAYKKDRYSGWLGGYRWLRDKLKGMPAKVNEFYEAGRELYLKQMDGVITRVAKIVGDDLTAAKKRIAAGKAEIGSYVNSLPAGLKKVGAEASKEIADKFEQLEDNVNAKQDSVVDTLATKYVEARKGLDERIEELQAENKGLIDKAIGAIKAIINTIRKLAAMLTDTLARVAHVVGDIIKHPIRFLGNLIDGVKGGILKFKDNILDHLRKGLMGWLFGALAEGGIELPDKVDPPGIIKLLASLFGLTWRNIRNRLVKQVGEKAMAAIEKGVEIFQIISGPAGVAGLWQMLMNTLGGIKEMILEQVKDFVITRIITAGITWLISLLNPAAAFIKACKLIYDIIMFFVNNAERILKFVNTIIDSVVDIVRGNIGGVVAKIEDALGQMVPILIGFLASVLGIGGIGQKIREIIGKLQKPVTKAIDFVIKTGLKLAGPIIRGLKGIGGKVKAKVAAGKAWVKGKAEAGKKWVKAKVYGGDDTVEGKQQRLTKGVRTGVAGANRLAGRPVGDRVLRPLLAAVRVRYGLAVLEPVRQGRFWAVHGQVQRMTEETKLEVLATEELDEVYALQKEVSPVQDGTRRALDSAARKATKSGGASLNTIRSLQARYAPLEKEFLEHKAALAAMRKSGKGDPAKLTAMRTRFPALRTEFQAIQDSSKLATADPAEIEAQAKLLRGEIDGKVTKAQEIMARPDVVTYVLNNPVQADLTSRLRNRLKAIADALAALPVPVNSIPGMAQLRSIMDIANGLQTDATQADKFRQLIVQIKEEATSIDRIVAQTTIEGRPEAKIADPEGVFEFGSSEAAARHEVYEGPKEGRIEHGDKCSDDARGLRAAIANLKALRELPGAAQVEAEIKAALAKAEKRLPGLEAGAAVWENRKKTHPHLWGDDDKSGGTT